MRSEHYRTWPQARKHAQLAANEYRMIHYAFQEWNGTIAVEIDYPKSGIEWETFHPESEPTATLKAKVRRHPESLGSFHYSLEPGTKVYIVTRYSDGFALVSTVPRQYRIADDNFRVSMLNLKTNQ